MSSSLVTTSPRSSTSPVRTPRSPRVEAFGLSHPGLVRPTNEDAFIVAADVGLFAVCDGLGGNAAGEVASRMAVDTLLAALKNAHRPGLPLLVSAVEHANAGVYAASCTDRAHAGMATTSTALLILGETIALAHVGDSRAYRLRARHLEQLTDDHLLVNELLRAGVMTEHEAATSDKRNMITRAVGAEESVEVDARLLAAEPGDTLLLASDGLHGVVGDEDIVAILRRERDLTRAAVQLIERANDRGGPDNTTVVLVRIG
jgi:serine/threonine protein phosphatase PrpC